MKEFETFYIDSIKIKDAQSLSELMISNTQRFERFMPKTLAQNQNSEDAQSYILGRVEETQKKATYTFTIKEKTNNKLVGLVFIKDLDWKNMEGEFAYCMDKKFTGKGWTSQSVKQLSTFAFTDLKLKTLKIITHKNNVASIKLAENCGFIWQRTLINEFTPQNESPLDMELYELNR